MRRASVYAERASLSPDGGYLLSFIGKFRLPFHAYSVLSRPPYFTALALWPADDTWGGGGQFVGPREFVLNHAEAEPMIAPGFRWPGGFVMHTAGPAGRARLERWRKTRDDWQPREQAPDGGSYSKRAGDAKLVATWRRLPRYRVRWDYTLAVRGAEAALPSRSQWAEFDSNGDIVLAAGGRLDRLPAAAFAEAVACGDAAPFARRLADFTDMRYEPVLAPYATGGVVQRGAREAVDSESTFAPRLDRVSKEDRRRRIADRKALRQQR